MQVFHKFDQYPLYITVPFIFEEIGEGFMLQMDDPNLKNFMTELIEYKK